MNTLRDHAGDGGERILIVEDNRAIANALKLVLQTQGYETRWCDDDTLYGLIEEWQPSLILMDLKMPRLDGDHATATIKANPVMRSIPVIVITADNVTTERLATMQADDLLTKPFAVPRLLERVSYWLTRPEAADDQPATEAGQSGGTPEQFLRQSPIPLQFATGTYNGGAPGFAGQNPA